MHRGVGPLPSPPDGLGEGEDGVQIALALRRTLGFLDQATGVGKPPPEDAEGVEHGTTSQGLRLLQRLAHRGDLGRLGRREAFRGQGCPGG